MNKFSTEEMINKMLAGDYIYDSENIGVVYNQLDSIYKDCKDPIDIFNKMADSDDYTILIALAFVIELTPMQFINQNSSEIRQLLRKAISKRCFRANLDFCRTFSKLLVDDNDYEVYIEMIESEQYLESTIATTQLLNMKQREYIKFNELSRNLDFTLFLSKKIINYSLEDYLEVTTGKINCFKRVILTALYKSGFKKQALLDIAKKDEFESYDYITVFLN